MHDIRHDTKTQPEPASTTARRVGAVVMGAASLGLFVFGVFAMFDVADTYGDAFGGGWGLLWILVGAMASFIGAGAVAMWRPDRAGVTANALFWIAGVAIVVYGLVFLFASP